MEILDMSGLNSITPQENGEKIIDGTFEGQPITQSLPEQSHPGFWVFNMDIYDFEFIVLYGNYKFVPIE